MKTLSVTGFRSETSLYTQCATAALGSLVLGYTIANLNTPFEYIAAINEWTGATKIDYERWLQTSVPVGAALGALFSGPIAGTAGRRTTLLLADIITIFSVILTLINSITWMTIGRFIAGFAIGINSAAVPLYISEMSPKELRGTTGTFHWLMLTLGSVLAFIFSGGIPTRNASTGIFPDYHSQWWRFMLLFPLFIAGLRTILMRIEYRFETPRWLYQQGNVEETKRVLDSIYLANEVEVQFNGLRDLSMGNMGSGGSTYGELFQHPLRGCFIAATGLAIFNQMVGINALIFYSHKLFRGTIDHAYHDETATLYTILIGLFLLFAACFTIFTVEMLGRKTILLAGGAAMALCLGGMIFAESQNFVGVSRFFLLGYVLSYGLSWGPVSWVMIGELLNAKGISLATFINWLCCISIVQATPYVLNSFFGITGSIVIFLITTLLATGFVLAFVHETKHLSKPEIQVLYGLDQQATIKHSVMA